MTRFIRETSLGFNVFNLYSVPHKLPLNDAVLGNIEKKNWTEEKNVSNGYVWFTTEFMKFLYNTSAQCWSILV